MCLVLSNAFGNGCGVVNVHSADTSCPKIAATNPTCASECSKSSWCYYAAVNAIMCPREHELSSMTPAEVTSLHNEILSLTERCQEEWWTSESPSSLPSHVPSTQPTEASHAPSAAPSPQRNEGTATVSPTQSPTNHATLNPTHVPTHVPTHSPTRTPTSKPTPKPTTKMTPKPTMKPSPESTGEVDDTNDDIVIPDLEHPVESISGGGNHDHSLGGATSSTIGNHNIYMAEWL